MAKTTLHSRSHLRFRFLPFLLLAKMALVAAPLLLGFIGSNLDNIAAMVMMMMTKMEMMDDTAEEAVKRIDDGGCKALMSNLRGNTAPWH